MIAISETKLNNNQININIDSEGYVFINKNSPTKAGGVGFYIKKEISYSQIGSSCLNLPLVEDMWIKIDAKPSPIVVGAIYRHPNYNKDNIENFSNALNTTLHNLNLNSSKFFILGDLNLDLLKKTIILKRMLTTC